MTGWFQEYTKKNRKFRALTRDKYFFGSETNQKNDKTAVHISLSTLGFLNQPNAQSNGRWVYWDKLLS